MGALAVAFVALTWYLIWMKKHIGIPTSISSTFYYAKTRWTYTAVIGGIGALMTLVDPHSLLHYAGISLVLGTAAPDFKDDKSESKLLHFGFTACTAMLAWMYLFGWWGLLGGVIIGGAKLLSSKLKFKNAVFYTELLLFYSLFIGTLIKIL